MFSILGTLTGNASVFNRSLNAIHAKYTPQVGSSATRVITQKPLCKTELNLVLELREQEGM